MLPLQSILDAIDAANAHDPNQELADGRPWPAQVLYSHRMTAALHRLSPNPTPPLQIAARGQHIRRWTIPRSSEAPDRIGYLKWRTGLSRFHAAELENILRTFNADDAIIARVQSLVRKEKLKLEPEAQILEDAICLVFLEHQLANFAASHDEAKVIDILRKTWKKMGDRGRALALKLPLSPSAAALVSKAIAE